VSRLTRLLKSPKEKDALTEHELQMNCSKCGKRPAREPEGLCNQCRFDDILTEMVNKK